MSADSPTMAESLQATLGNCRKHLLAHWHAGAFRGELSGSALSTATAAMACALAAKQNSCYASLAEKGHQWLVTHQNEDGGFGDTTDSPSNISTTTVCWASLSLGQDVPQKALDAVEAWLRRACDGSLEPEILAAKIKARYGKDHTFSVPILTTCALAGKLGEGRDAWRLVPALPFELASCPQDWFRWLNLRTVSYALPALIAIGQVRHFFRPTRNPLTRLPRNLAKKYTLGILRKIQPESGGFLEAAPLTSFVSMSLLAMGLHDHPVVENGLRFLCETVRDDGCWPIDTNLDTWTTSLAVHALGPECRELLGEERSRATARWMLDQQYLEVHPYTNTPPGGWAWTDLSGGVPDGDDTPGALLAIGRLPIEAATQQNSARSGLRWLFGLQNRDGGFPTFCRGWGKLPFDRSSPDLTAHCLRAIHTWGPRVLETKSWQAQLERGIDYLCRTQQDDGTWIPLWFGNQHQTTEDNPMYGTSRVLLAVTEVLSTNLAWNAAGERAIRWILSVQDQTGGFGAGPGVPCSIEETGMALEAIAAWAERHPSSMLNSAIERAVQWLSQATHEGRNFPTAPIGLYFAKLWYFEKLYPVLFTTAALTRVQKL